MTFGLLSGQEPVEPSTTSSAIGSWTGTIEQEEYVQVADIVGHLDGSPLGRARPRSSTRRIVSLIDNPARCPPRRATDQISGAEC